MSGDYLCVIYARCQVSPFSLYTTFLRAKGGWWQRVPPGTNSWCRKTSFSASKLRSYNTWQSPHPVNLLKSMESWRGVQVPTTCGRIFSADRGISMGKKLKLLWELTNQLFCYLTFMHWCHQWMLFVNTQQDISYIIAHRTLVTTTWPTIVE